MVHRGLLGVHQSETVNFFQGCLWKNLNFGDYTNDKHMIFLQNKFQINFEIFVPKITWSHICVILLQHPRKNPDL